MVQVEMGYIHQMYGCVDAWVMRVFSLLPRLLEVLVQQLQIKELQQQVDAIKGEIKNLQKRVAAMSKKIKDLKKKSMPVLPRLCSLRSHA